VRYTLVSGLGNVFARLGLPVIALLAVAMSGKPGGVLPAASYCGAGALLVAGAGFQFLLRSQRFALLAGQFLQRAETLVCRLARRSPSQRMTERVLGFRAGTSALLAERGIRITVTTMLASIAPWPVLLACLRARGLSQAQVSWQASLAAFAMIQLLTVLPVPRGPRYRRTRPHSAAGRRARRRPRRCRDAALPRRDLPALHSARRPHLPMVTALHPQSVGPYPGTVATSAT
jgi:putative heme transporter